MELDEYKINREFSLIQILSILTNSKRLFFITLILTLISVSFYLVAFRDYYESTALVKIGSYKSFASEKGQIAPFGKANRIENVKDLETELNNLFIRSEKENIDKNIFSITEKFNSFIEIKARSNISPEQSKNSVMNVAGYIINKHNKIFVEIKLNASNSLNSATNKKNTDLNLIKLQSDLVTINLVSELETIDAKIKILEEIIQDEERNLSKLKDNPDLFLERLAQEPSMQSVIHAYKSELLDLTLSKVQIEGSINSGFQLILPLLSADELKNFDIMKKVIMDNFYRDRDYYLRILDDFNYINSALSGELKTELKPILSRKIVTVIFLFVMSLIISIFISLALNSLETYRKTTS